MTVKVLSNSDFDGTDCDDDNEELNLADVDGDGECGDDVYHDADDVGKDGAHDDAADDEDCAGDDGCCSGGCGAGDGDDDHEA